MRLRKHFRARLFESQEFLSTRVISIRIMRTDIRIYKNKKCMHKKMAAIKIIIVKLQALRDGVVLTILTFLLWTINNRNGL